MEIKVTYRTALKTAKRISQDNDGKLKRKKKTSLEKITVQY